MAQEDLAAAEDLKIFMSDHGDVFPQGTNHVMMQTV